MTDTTPFKPKCNHCKSERTLVTGIFVCPRCDRATEQ